MSLQLNGHTTLLGFFADPAAHSKSPLMYNTAFEKLGINSVYLAFRINQKHLKDAVSSMRTLKMRGANVSMPNKNAVIQYLDALSPEARLCGAVNTIVNDNGILTGHNTDGKGAILALQSKGQNISAKKLVILGAGGAGTAILTQAALDGASEISVFVREKSLSKTMDLIGNIKKETSCSISLFPVGHLSVLKQELETAHILINATSVGMEHSEKSRSLIPDETYFHKDLFVMDIIYSPAQTVLLQMADHFGCRTMNGLGMLLYQGAAAFKLYTGEELPLEDVKKAWGISF